MTLIAAERYTSGEWLALELERVFARCWLLAAHSSELAEEGQYLLLELAGESLLIVRAADGVARAFYNVCAHRGMQLCPEERGRQTTFRCRYHHWEYELNGTLCRAPGAGAAAVDEFGAPVGLTPVACEESLGFVWVSLAKKPAPLAPLLEPIAEALAVHRPEEFRLSHCNTIEVEANWKASVDVNNEGYHLATLHPALLDFADPQQVRLGFHGPHSTFHIPLGAPAGARDDDLATGALRELVHSITNESLPDTSRVRDVRPLLARGARRRAEALGLSFAHRADDDLWTKQQFHLFPNVQLNFTPFCLELYRHRPHPTEPARCLFDEMALVRVGTGQAPTPSHARFRRGDRHLGSVMNEDVELLPSLQRGMRSRGFAGLRLTEGEACIAHMHRELERWIAQ